MRSKEFLNLVWIDNIIIGLIDLDDDGGLRPI